MHIILIIIACFGAIILFTAIMSNPDTKKYFLIIVGLGVLFVIFSLNYESSAHKDSHPENISVWEPPKVVEPVQSSTAQCNLKLSVNIPNFEGVITIDANILVVNGVVTQVPTIKSTTQPFVNVDIDTRLIIQLLKTKCTGTGFFKVDEIIRKGV